MDKKRVFKVLSESPAISIFSEGKRLLSYFIQCLLQIMNNSTYGQLTRVAQSRLYMLGSLRKASQERNDTIIGQMRSFSNQETLPPIRRICSSAQEVNSEGGNSPLMFLKLPRLERRPVVKSKTPSSLQENEQKNESYKSYVVIDNNSPPLEVAAKQGAYSLERWRGFEDAQRFEETHVHSGVHRIGSVCREGDSPKNAITKEAQTTCAVTSLTTKAM